MADKKKNQQPISQTQVRTNRLRAIRTADASDRMAGQAAQSSPTLSDQEWARQEAIGLGLDPNKLTGDLSFGRATDAEWMAQEAENIRREYGTRLPANWTPYTGEYRGGGALFPTAPAAPAYPSYVAPTFTPTSVRNPYIDYTQGLTQMADAAAANFGTELADVQNRYKALRDQVMAQFGNTSNPELLAARDIALSELGRQADDATKQVAANYQAAQADQLRFAEQQRALGAELGAQNAILANVAAGNIAAYAEQAGLTDSAAQDISRRLASQAPREQALASALGLSGGMFESSMGTSLGEQQMAIQGQIARDLAARSGQVSTSTAQQIAAAQQAEREAGRQAYTNLVMQEMGALEAARAQQSQRDLALRQSILQGGLQGGMFDVEQAQRNEELAIRKEEAAYNRWLQGKEMSIKEQQLLDDKAQRDFQNQLALGEYEAKYGSTQLNIPTYVGPLISEFETKYKGSPMVSANIERLATVVAQGLNSGEAQEVAFSLLQQIRADKNGKKYFDKLGITSLSDFNRIYGSQGR